jgi:hypothetical protein
VALTLLKGKRSATNQLKINMKTKIAVFAIICSASMWAAAQNGANTNYGSPYNNNNGTNGWSDSNTNGAYGSNTNNYNNYSDSMSNTNSAHHWWQFWKH